MTRTAFLAALTGLVASGSQVDDVGSTDVGCDGDLLLRNQNTIAMTLAEMVTSLNTLHRRLDDLELLLRSGANNQNL